jgi:uncharacterized protein with PIN domain
VLDYVVSDGVGGALVVGLAVMSTEAFLTEEWNCARCNYRMTAVGRVDAPEQVPPDDQDLAMCLNCGAVYEMQAGKWRWLTDAGVRQLPKKLRRFLQRLERRRRLVVREDLQIRQKFKR